MKSLCERPSFFYEFLFLRLDARVILVDTFYLRVFKYEGWSFQATNQRFTRVFGSGPFG